MSKKTLSIVEGYYKAMEKKDIAEMEQYLHADATFIAPLATIVGKTAFLEGMKDFMNRFNKITIRAQFGCDDKNQAVVVYNLEFPAPIGVVPIAGLLTLKEDLIATIELFYDARLFGKI